MKYKKRETENGRQLNFGSNFILHPGAHLWQIGHHRAIITDSNIVMHLLSNILVSQSRTKGFFIGMVAAAAVTLLPILFFFHFQINFSYVCVKSCIQFISFLLTLFCFYSVFFIIFAQSQGKLWNIGNEMRLMQDYGGNAHNYILHFKQ